jgi:hypothetical protein
VRSDSEKENEMYNITREFVQKLNTRKKKDFILSEFYANLWTKNNQKKKMQKKDEFLRRVIKQNFGRMMHTERNGK